MNVNPNSHWVAVRINFFTKRQAFVIEING